MANNLTILAQGVLVRGNVFSEDVLVVEGGVEGNLFGNKIIIKGTGRVQGDLNCRSLSIETGGILNGMIKVSSEMPSVAYAMDEPKGLPEPEYEPEPAYHMEYSGQELERDQLHFDQADLDAEGERPVEMDYSELTSQYQETAPQYEESSGNYSDMPEENQVPTEHSATRS